jgi:hypothetical protein
MIHAALRSSNRRQKQNQDSEQLTIQPDKAHSAKRSANLAAPQRLNSVHPGKSCE